MKSETRYSVSITGTRTCALRCIVHLQMSEVRSEDACLKSQCELTEVSCVVPEEDEEEAGGGAHQHDEVDDRPLLDSGRKQFDCDQVRDGTHVGDLQTDQGNVL